MPVERRPIPLLPERPRAKPFAHRLSRSYPVGHQSYSRTISGCVLELTISSAGPFPDGFQAALVTTLNAPRDGEWIEAAFAQTGATTLTCRLTPERPGLFSFRAHFSLDGGSTWLPDAVPDAWVLVDPPQVDDVRMYTMIPTVSGTIADWKADLGRIKEMGFNAIHLLPVTPMDTTESPYAAQDLFDVDQSYLIDRVKSDGLSQLETYVEEAKALGIRLCFDLVLNHVGIKSRMAEHVPRWIVHDQDSPDGLKRARYWFDQEWHTWDDLALINYEHPSQAMRSEIWAYMTEYALFWAKYADYTHGFVRFDNLHSSDREFLDSLTKRLRQEYPKLGIIAEYFTDEGTLLDTLPRWGLNLILATPWNLKFVPQLRDYLKYVHHISQHVRYFMPINSHDSGSMAQEFGTSDSTVPRYVASALLGTGATGITQGVEWGSAEKIPFIGRQPKLATPKGPRFAEFLRKVNEIVADHPAFRMGGNCEFVDEGHAAVIAAFRSGSGARNTGFLVACNFDIYNEEHFETDLSSIVGNDGPVAFRDLLSDEEFSFPSAQVRVVLPPSGAKILMLTTFSVG